MLAPRTKYADEIPARVRQAKLRTAGGGGGRGAAASAPPPPPRQAVVVTLEPDEKVPPAALHALLPPPGHPVEHDFRPDARVTYYAAGPLVAARLARGGCAHRSRRDCAAAARRLAGGPLGLSACFQFFKGGVFPRLPGGGDGGGGGGESSGPRPPSYPPPPASHPSYPGPPLPPYLSPLPPYPGQALYPGQAPHPGQSAYHPMQAPYPGQAPHAPRPPPPPHAPPLGGHVDPMAAAIGAARQQAMQAKVAAAVAAAVASHRGTPACQGYHLKIKEDFTPLPSPFLPSTQVQPTQGVFTGPGTPVGQHP